MSASSNGAAPALPISHTFVSIASGSSIRTLSMRTGTFRCVCALLVALTGWLIGSGLYLTFHDDLVAALMARQVRAQYAYEDRIAALREQVEREASRQTVGQSTLEDKVRDLSLRATLLETRASLVSQLADRAGVRLADHAATANAAALPEFQRNRHDRSPVGLGSAELSGSSIVPLASSAPVRLLPLPGQAEKPRPEFDAGPFDAISGQQSAIDAPSFRLRLAALIESLERVDGSQYKAIALVDGTARRTTEAIETVMTEAGLSPGRFKAEPPKSDMGGPFVPLDEAFTSSPFGRAFATLQADVAVSEHLRRIMPRVPFASPLVGATEVTSPFGPRVDPFLGRPAMHTGVDLREDYGTEVRATAAGRVVNAGPAGGYGNMIEVDHGNGLATRYAHLEAILVSDGQIVAKGEVIGRVGSTGRATGPHLHYETRIDGEPVDPIRFLRAGQNLAALDPKL